MSPSPIRALRQTSLSHQPCSDKATSWHTGRKRHIFQKLWYVYYRKILFEERNHFQIYFKRFFLPTHVHSIHMEERVREAFNLTPTPQQTAAWSLLLVALLRWDVWTVPLNSAVAICVEFGVGEVSGKLRGTNVFSPLGCTSDRWAGGVAPSSILLVVWRIRQRVLLGGVSHNKLRQ